MNLLEGRINVLPRLSTSQHNLSRRKYQQTNLRLLHMVNEAGKSIRVKIAKHRVVALVKAFQLDFEIHTTRTYHILDFEVRQINLVSNLFYCFRIMLCRIQTQLLTLGTGNNHLACFENKSGGSSGFTHSHNHCSKTLWVVLSVSALKGDFLKV